MPDVRQTEPLPFPAHMRGEVTFDDDPRAEEEEDDWSRAIVQIEVAKRDA